MAFYRTGTAAVTQGGKTVTGTGTLWAVTVQPGDAFVVTDANGLAVGGIYEIASVNSNTSLTLYQNYQGTTASGLAYAVLNMAGDQTTASFANRLSQFFDKQQALLNAPGVNVIKVGGVTFSPDAVARMVEFVAGAGVTLTPSAAGKTVTIAGAQATESAIGSVELATAAEAAAGTDTVRAVTPAGALALLQKWGLGGVLGICADADALGLQCGIYRVNGAWTGSPVSGTNENNIGTLFHLPEGTGTDAYMQQFLLRRYVSVSASGVGIMMRRKISGTWGAWMDVFPNPSALGITSTDDATSPTGAPLKSAGGLAVAKSVQIGHGIILGGRSVSQVFWLGTALNASGKGVSIPLGLFTGFIDVCVSATNYSVAMSMKRAVFSLSVNTSTGAHITKQSTTVASHGPNVSQINIDLVKDTTGAGTSLVVWSTGADLAGGALLDVRVTGGGTVSTLTYTAVTV